LSSNVLIITPSFNKGKYILDNINSVLSQTHQDWQHLIIDNSIDNNITRNIIKDYLTTINDSRIIYIERNFTPEERHISYIPSLIINEYIEWAKDYIFYLSDDDYIKPNCLEKMVNYLDSNLDKSVCWITSQIYVLRDNEFIFNNEITADMLLTQGRELDCCLDGGQILFRKSCLDKLEKPYYQTTRDGCNHCDGTFLTKLSKEYPMYPVCKEPLLIIRRTEISTHGWQSVRPFVEEPTFGDENI